VGSTRVFQAVLIRKILADEVSGYKNKNTVQELNPEVKSLAFWFAKRERFLQLFELAIRYLSVPGNSFVLSEASANTVNSPQCHCLTDDNLALYVMMTANGRR